MSTKEIKSIIDNPSKQKTPNPDTLTGEYFQKVQEEITPSLQALLDDKSRGTLPNSIYEDTVTLLTKPKILHKRKLQSHSSWDHRFKTLNRKVISNHAC